MQEFTSSQQVLFAKKKGALLPWRLSEWFLADMDDCAAQRKLGPKVVSEYT